MTFQEASQKHMLLGGFLFIWYVSPDLAIGCNYNPGVCLLGNGHWSYSVRLSHRFRSWRMGGHDGTRWKRM